MFPQRVDEVVVSELKAAFYLTSSVEVKVSCMMALMTVLSYVSHPYDQAQIVDYCRQYVQVLYILTTISCPLPPPSSECTGVFVS